MWWFSVPSKFAELLLYFIVSDLFTSFGYASSKMGLCCAWIATFSLSGLLRINSSWESNVASSDHFVVWYMFLHTWQLNWVIIQDTHLCNISLSWLLLVSYSILVWLVEPFCSINYCESYHVLISLIDLKRIGLWIFLFLFLTKFGLSHRRLLSALYIVCFFDK